MLLTLKVFFLKSEKENNLTIMYIIIRESYKTEKNVKIITARLDET